MKKLVVISAVFFSGLAVAQSLPRFGTAKFGQAVFGEASVGTTSVGADALPVPSCPCGQPSHSLSCCGLWPADAN